MHLFPSRAENCGVWVGCSKHMVLVCFFGYLSTWPKASVCRFEDEEPEAQRSYLIPELGLEVRLELW